MLANFKEPFNPSKDNLNTKSLFSSFRSQQVSLSVP